MKLVSDEFLIMLFYHRHTFNGNVWWFCYIFFSHFFSFSLFQFFDFGYMIIFISLGNGKCSSCEMCMRLRATNFIKSFILSSSIIPQDHKLLFSSNNNDMLHLFTFFDDFFFIFSIIFSIFYLRFVVFLLTLLFVFPMLYSIASCMASSKEEINGISKKQAKQNKAKQRYAKEWEENECTNWIRDKNTYKYNVKCVNWCRS